jgi:outer membrane lipoprotein-sorting protein
MSPRKRLLLTVGLAMALVTSGCVSGPLSEDQEAELADRVEGELGDIDAYEATIVTEVTLENRTVETERRVKVNLNTGETYQRTLAPADREGDLFVSNGSVAWNYDASENAVHRFDSGGAATLGQANVTNFLQNLGDRYNVTVEGSATIDGTETHVAELTPEQSNVDGNMTVWLDKSTYFPVKITQTFAANDQSFETTIWFENVTLDPEFEPGIFDYEPPADATVDTVDLPESERFDSMTALEDAANQSVASVELPDDFAFERGMVILDDGNETVRSVYTNESARVSVAQYTERALTTDGEDLTVNGHDATLTTYGDTAMVTWTCEGTMYAVTTSAGADFATDVAASVDC